MITILTPTYNRGYLLSNLYNSLESQTSKDFEWIIIDDGSEDNTEEIVKGWQKKNNTFKIHYFKTSNGGKHRAVNFGVSKAYYDYVFIVDSDDYILEMAVEKVQGWIQSIDKDKSFAGVSGLKGYKDNTVVGYYPSKIEYKDYIDATNLERKACNLLGDKAEIYRTEILRKYPFPEFKNEKFITEAAVWNAIAHDGYKIRWFNEIIYICEYNEDGLTKLGIEKEINNFNGFIYYIKLRMKTEKVFLNLAPLCSFSNVARLKRLSVAQMADIVGVNIVIMRIANIIDCIYRRIQDIKREILKH